MKYLFLISIFVGNLSMVAQSPGKIVRMGNFNYLRGKYDEAEIKYREALDKKPELTQANFNLGNTNYRQEEYEAAINKYSEAIKSTKDPKRLSDYYYNMGNAYYKHNNFKASIEAYKNALRNNPDNNDARHNLMLAQKMLTKQNQQNQQDNQNDNDKEPSQYAKDLKKRAQELVNQRKYSEAYTLMLEGEQKDPTVAYFRKFTDRIKEVDDVQNQ